MAKKKRQLRWLLLLLAVAVALFVAAFCWNRWRTAQEEAEAEAAVIHVDLVEDPTKLTYSNGTDTITFDDLKAALDKGKTGSDLDCSTAP